MPRALLAVAAALLLAACKTTEAEKQAKISALFAEGAQEEGKKDWEAARDRYSKIVSINSRHARGYFKRGRAWASEASGKQMSPERMKTLYLEAVADFSRAIEVLPLYTAALYNRGEIYHEMWNMDLATEEYLRNAMHDYQRVLEVNPKDQDALYKLAALMHHGPFVQRAMKHKAIAYYRRYLAVVGADDQVERWLEKLLREYGEPPEPGTKPPAGDGKPRGPSKDEPPAEAPAKKDGPKAPQSPESGKQLPRAPEGGKEPAREEPPKGGS